MRIEILYKKTCSPSRFLSLRKKEEAELSATSLKEKKVNTLQDGVTISWLN